MPTSPRTRRAHLRKVLHVQNTLSVLLVKEGFVSELDPRAAKAAVQEGAILLDTFLLFELAHHVNGEQRRLHCARDFVVRRVLGAHGLEPLDAATLDEQLGIPVRMGCRFEVNKLRRRGRRATLVSLACFHARRRTQALPRQCYRGTARL